MLLEFAISTSRPTASAVDIDARVWGRLKTIQPSVYLFVYFETAHPGCKQSSFISSFTFYTFSSSFLASLFYFIHIHHITIQLKIIYNRLNFLWESVPTHLPSHLQISMGRHPIFSPLTLQLPKPSPSARPRHLHHTLFCVWIEFE